MVDTMVPNSGPWSLLGQSVSYIIKLAPILWWALPTGPAVPRPESPNASAYSWLPETCRWCPVISNLLAIPPNVTQTPQNLGVFPEEYNPETLVPSQCPKFYAEDTLILS
ncbi:hypothetical protein DSO57_1036783 [Entomophthora muscae]|uniref:Uncharacterized protein n=1 Tax=Entomophthora muscae TaxID=34485 RepID=A0ACC2UJ16_9FUNG|nr:hypothetical protein DSO57_1036783 [Entomophthora muscae]